MCDSDGSSNRSVTDWSEPPLLYTISTSASSAKSNTCMKGHRFSLASPSCPSEVLGWSVRSRVSLMRGWPVLPD